MKKFLIYLIVMLIPAAFISAEDGDGGYAGSFMQVPMGARAVGMGGAYISLSDDGSGILYNPAGITVIRQKVFTSSYRAMSLDRTLGFIGILLPTKDMSTFGLNWLYAGSGAVTARNTDGDALDFDVTEHNHAFSIVFAKRFEKYMALGFRGSYLHTSFSELRTNSIKMDFGAMFYLSQLMDRDKREMFPIKDIQAGVVVKNLVALYRWNNEKYFAKYSSNIYGSEQEDRVPVEVGIGASARFMERKLIVASDLTKNDKQGFVFHAGSEYFVSKELSLRAGYNDKSVTAGAGFIFKFGKNNLAVDYGFSSSKYSEGSEHIFSFDLLF